MGLAITKRIVELMGGKVFVESIPRVGSKFWFDLDLPVLSTPKESIAQLTAKIIGYSGPRRKILVVDDRWENRTVLIDMLEPIGFELEQAEDGQDGLKKAIEYQPDLILVDLVMPVMDGYQLTRRLRQLPEFHNTTIVAISASVFEEDRQQSLEAGCNDFLPKPVRSEDLLEKVKSSLNLSWIFDNESETRTQELGNESNRVTQTEISIPPADELFAVYQAAISADIQIVEEEIIRLQQLNSEYIPFMNQIQEFADEFNYQKITNLIKVFCI